jgi:hypothetical protein
MLPLQSRRRLHVGIFGFHSASKPNAGTLSSCSIFFPAARHVLVGRIQRYIVKSADTLDLPRHGPQHLAIKSIPIHFNKTTQTVSKLTTVLLTGRTGRANGKELFGVVPHVTIERGVWCRDSGQADVRSCRWKFAL